MSFGVLDDFLERPTGQKAGVVGLVLLVVIVANWMLFLSKQNARLSELKTELAQVQEELADRRGKTNTAEDEKRELRELTARLNRAQARLPDQREIADLLTSVADSGRAAGLEIVLFRPRPEVYHDFYAEVPVQMEMRGTYHDVALFLDSVKQLDRIVNVSDIKLTKPRVEGDRVLLEASCTPTTFRFLTEEERSRLKEQKAKKGKAA